MEWGRRYPEYRKEMEAALSQGAEGKDCSPDDVIKKYKQLLYGAPDFEESPRRWDDIFNEALAIYNISYEYATGRHAAIGGKAIGLCGFAWKVADPALCQIYAMKQGQKSIVCLPSVLKEIFS
ncbi:probable RNA-dependent RNA polymerase 5 [Syzygium oleosum]|uniref:probable RNA-dependent RNA polymerase 5 n=1 Tax=Syzygium oleosum TaxID=219896 RepID=UPI0024BBC2BB|nr:probable RNA-dependent RNA polymerase 5 [Syzygium oleosum]